MISTHISTVVLFVKTARTRQRKCLRVPNCTHIESMLINFIWISLCNITSMPGIYINLKKTWQHKRDSDGPSACRKPDGKQWQRFTRGLKYWLLALCLGYISNNARILNPSYFDAQCYSLRRHGVQFMQYITQSRFKIILRQQTWRILIKDSRKPTSNYHNRKNHWSG